MSKLVVYKDSGYLLNVKSLTESQIEDAKDRFTFSMYDHGNCDKCEQLEYRHSEVCDGCASFLGHRALAKEVERGDQVLLSLPFGAKEEVRKYLKTLGRPYKVVSRHPSDKPFSRPIKFTAQLREYQVDAKDSIIKEKKGIIKAPPRSGKCVDGSTLVMTDRGLHRIDSLFEDVPFHSDKATIASTSDTFITTVKGPREVSGLYTRVVDDTVKVVTAQGYSIKGTPNHPVLVARPGFKHAWVPLEDVSEGDYLVVSRKQQWLGSGSALNPFDFVPHKNASSLVTHAVPAVLDRKLARLLGYLVANGGLSVKNRVSFTSNNDLVREDYKRVLRSLFPSLAFTETVQGLNGHHKVSGVTWSSQYVKDFLKQACDLAMTKSRHKYIPDVILKGDKKFLLEFLSAYISCDSWVHEKGIGLCSASNRLMRELHSVLSYLGVVGTFRRSESSAKNGNNILRPYYSVNIHRNDAEVLLGQITLRKPYKMSTSVYVNQNDVLPYVKETLAGFQQKYSHPTKQAWVKGNSTVSKHSTGGLIAENKTGLTSDKPVNRTYTSRVNRKVVKWLNPKLDDKLTAYSNPDLFYSPVVSTFRSNKPTRVFDVEVPEGRNFLANNIVSHNTVIGTATICEIGQKTIILAAQREWLIGFQETFLGNASQEAMTNARSRQIGFCKTYEDFEKTDVCLATFAQFFSPSGRKMLNRIKNMFVVMGVDEVHLCSALETSRVLAQFNAEYRFGLTGTPERKQADLVKIFFNLIGPIIYEAKVERLRPRVELLHTGCKQDIKGMGQAAFTRFVTAIEKDAARVKKICQRVVQLVNQGHMVLLPVQRVKSVDLYCKVINRLAGEGSRIAFPFYGTMDKARRKETINRCRDYRIKVLVGNSKLISVGLNIPRASCIFERVTPSSNIPNCDQRVSRVLTPMDGKPQPLIVYVLDDSKIMQSTARTEWWNCIHPRHRPLMDPRDRAILMEWFKGKTTNDISDLSDV